MTSNAVKLLSLRDIGFTGDIVEDGDSFEENSFIKASVPASLGYIGIADDSGLCVDYLDGAPGIYSARYSGEDADDESNRKKLLSALDGVAAGKRGAKFVCTACVVFPKDSRYIVPAEWRISGALAEKTGADPEKVMIVRGECFGTILTEEHGEGGFGYDSLFFHPDFGATFAEIPGEAKNTVSHRGIAMREFTKKLAQILEWE